MKSCGGHVFRRARKNWRRSRPTCRPAMLARTAGLSDRTISLNVTHLEQIRVWFGRPLRERHPVDAYLAS